MKNASKYIPAEDKKRICETKCDCSKCYDVYGDDCERMFAIYQTECRKNGGDKELSPDDIDKLKDMGVPNLYCFCKEHGINGIKTRQSREYYLAQLQRDGLISDKTLMDIIGEGDSGDSGDSEVQSGDVVKEPEHYKNGTFQVIDEMIVMFGVDDTITFCRLNAWKYRARAAYKGKFEEDMKKSDQYLSMAYELQAIRQEYPEAKGYEAIFLLKGKNETGRKVGTS